MDVAEDVGGRKPLFHGTTGCRDGELSIRSGCVAAELLAARTVGEHAFALDGDVTGVFAGTRGHADVDVGVAPVDFETGCASTAAEWV